MSSVSRKLLAIGIAILGFNSTQAQDHGHLHIGAENQTVGAKLIFSDRAQFETNSLYVKTLTNAASGSLASYYIGNITITGLAATDLFQGPEPFAASLGTYIFAQISHVEGPPGGSFNWWDTGATEPTISIPSGGSSTETFLVTSTDGSAGADPYGHIHGRRFSATAPGIYAVTFRAFDQGMNGPEGGPIHAPADSITIYFQAGVNMFDVRFGDGAASIRFGAYAGRTWQVESTDVLPATNWVAVGAPIVGDDKIREVTDASPSATGRYYRLKEVITP